MNGDMDALWWLALANGVVWLGLCGYLAFLGLRQQTLAKMAESLRSGEGRNDD